MDPDAAYADLTEALRERDTTAAREAFENLIDWIDRGGFLPAALAAPEEAFRAGFKAGWGVAKAERIYPIEQEEDEAWSDFKPTASQNAR